MELGGIVVDVEPHYDVIALCVGLVLAYVGAIVRYGKVFHPAPGDRPVSTKQAVSFGGGVLALWIASGSPLHDIAESSLYSAHMVQHLLQAFVIPPLLLLGIPRWMGELILRPRWVRGPLKVISQPLVAALFFNLVLLLIHWPAIVDGMIASELFHGVTHIVLVVAATAMWIPLVSPVPDILPRLQPLAQMLYLFTMTILPTVPSAFLTFGEEPLFRVYEELPRAFGLSAAEDMRIAGLIMKIGGGFFLCGIIATMFFRWAAEQERQEQAERREAATTSAR
jgi:putative membrane protein